MVWSFDGPTKNRKRRKNTMFYRSVISAESIKSKTKKFFLILLGVKNLKKFNCEIFKDVSKQTPNYGKAATK